MRFQVEEKRRKANILNSMQQYVYDGAIVRTPLVRALLASLVAAALVAVDACSKSDNTPPVATVTVTPSKTRVALGSPLDLTYRFDVAPGTTIPGDYRVFVHFVKPDGQILWSDDHDIPADVPPTSQWKPGQNVQYTMSRFIPVVPYNGDANIEVGLYRESDRLPLQALENTDHEKLTRSYKVTTLTLLPQSENILVIFKGGWHPAEFSGDDAAVSWQWTQKSGVLSIKNPHKDATLFLEYDARPDLFAGQAQQVSVYVGDQLVQTFAADNSGRTLKRIPMTAAQLGGNEMTDLRIDVDKTFVPAKMPAGGRDIRELGIRVYHAFVESR